MNPEIEEFYYTYKYRVRHTPIESIRCVDIIKCYDNRACI